VGERAESHESDLDGERCGCSDRVLPTSSSEPDTDRMLDESFVDPISGPGGLTDGGRECRGGTAKT
jgi:hypothetical protein